MRLCTRITHDTRAKDLYLIEAASEAPTDIMQGHARVTKFTVTQTATFAITQFS